MTATLCGLVLGQFVWHEARTTEPLLPLRIVLDRQRGASYVCALLAVGGMFGAFLFLTCELQVVLSFTPLMAGIAHFISCNRMTVFLAHCAFWRELRRPARCTSRSNRKPLRRQVVRSMFMPTPDTTRANTCSPASGKSRSRINAGTRHPASSRSRRATPAMACARLGQHPPDGCISSLRQGSSAISWNANACVRRARTQPSYAHSASGTASEP